MSNANHSCEVAIVGMGPTGVMLAHLLIPQQQTANGNWWPFTSPAGMPPSRSTREPRLSFTTAKPAGSPSRT